MRNVFEDYRWLIEYLPLPCFVINEQMMVYLNEAGRRLLGAERVPDFNRALCQWIAPEDIRTFRGMLERTYDWESVPEQYEQRWLRLDGKTIYLEVTASVVWYKQERHIQLVCHDVTERKKRENCLRESEQRYRDLLRRLPEGVIIHSNAVVIYANQAACNILRAESEQELLGRNIFEFVHPDNLVAARKWIFDNRSWPPDAEYEECKIVCVDGETRDAEVTSNEVFEWNGDTVIQTVFRDVTERKRREQFLRQSDKLSAVGQLAAGVAHEIRNPLTTLIGFTQLMPEKPERMQEYCKIMYDELTRIRDIVNEFMSLSKPQVIRFQHQSVNTLLSDLIPIIQSAAILSNVDIHAELDEELPPVLVDANQLKQVFLNLMKNAIEAMPDGGTLSIRTMMHRDLVYIRFTDTGIGIPEDKIRRLGEPFYTTKESGTGLGIMVSYRIIQAHGGRMYFTSQVGSGTSVHIELPVRRKEQSIAL